VIVPGKAQGHLVVANLCTLTHLLATPYMPDLQGALLCIEEVGERLYRIDRMLTQLLLAGALLEVAGIALGCFTGCEDPPGTENQVAVDEVLADRLSQLAVPVGGGFPFGHGCPNFALPTRMHAELDVDAGTLTVVGRAP